MSAPGPAPDGHDTPDGHLGPGMGRARWVLVGIGLVLIGIGAVLAVLAIGRPRDLVSLAAWVLIPALASDLVLMPAAAVIGSQVRRRVPRGWRAPLAAGLVLTTTLVAIGWPFLGGFGRQAANPSLLDRPYWLGLGAYLAVVWAGVLVAGVIGWRRSVTSGGRADGPRPAPAP